MMGSSNTAGYKRSRQHPRGKSNSGEYSFVSKLYHDGTSRGVAGYKVNITITGPARRSNSCLFALATQALRSQEFEECVGD